MFFAGASSGWSSRCCRLRFWVKMRIWSSSPIAGAAWPISPWQMPTVASPAFLQPVPPRLVAMVRKTFTLWPRQLPRRRPNSSHRRRSNNTLQDLVVGIFLASPGARGETPTRSPVPARSLKQRALPPSAVTFCAPCRVGRQQLSSLASQAPRVQGRASPRNAWWQHWRQRRLSSYRQLDSCCRSRKQRSRRCRCHMQGKLAALQWVQEQQAIGQKLQER